MESFLMVIVVVFGILQIILFFKIWGMTNDVNKIKNKMGETSITEDAQVSFLKGQKDKAKDLLDTAFFKSILEAANDEYTAGYADKLNAINNLYHPIYKSMGFETPDIEKYKDQNNLPL